MNLEEVVTHYGYIGILIGTFLEGETILIIAGFLAHRGYLELPFVIVAAFFGSLIGDQLYFYIGRFKGREFIRKKSNWKSKTNHVFRLLNKYHILFILGFRFLYGIRTVAPFALGASSISPIRFLVLNIAGALVWAIVIGMLGYYFGYAIEMLIGEVKQYEEWVSSVCCYLVLRYGFYLNGVRETHGTKGYSRREHERYHGQSAAQNQ